MRTKTHRVSQPELKMTPMIDVIFLLLVFFVCTANFNPTEEILPLDSALPGSVESEVVLPEHWEPDVVRIRIEIADRLSWQVEGLRLSSLGEVYGLLEQIHGIKADIPVILESADDVPIDGVLDVYDVCRRVGFFQIQFSAD